MIDTLKLSKRLQEADLPKNQAEAIAEGIRENLVTNEKLVAELAKLQADITTRLLEMQNRFYGAVIGVYALIVVSVFVNHFWK